MEVHVIENKPVEMANWYIDFLVEIHEASRGRDDQVIDILLKWNLLNILGGDVDDVKVVFGLGIKTNTLS